MPVVFHVLLNYPQMIILERKFIEVLKLSCGNYHYCFIAQPLLNPVQSFN